MRIVASTGLKPVSAVSSTKNRDHEPESGKAVDLPAGARKSSGAFAPATAAIVPAWKNDTSVGVGLAAQQCFHACYGDPAEERLPKVVSTYEQAEALRCRAAPFSRQAA